MRKTFLLLIILAVFLFANIAYASPSVSYTSSSYNGKVTLIPTINSDVTDYKWEMIKKGGGYESETQWITSGDITNHVSYLDSGHYFVTMKGRNTTTDEEVSFTNKVVATVRESYVRPEEPVIEEDIGSRIINSLPEPLKSFLLRRNSFELGLIIIGSLLGMLLISRRERVKKYVLLERYK